MAWFSNSPDSREAKWKNGSYLGAGAAAVLTILSLYFLAIKLT